VPAWLQQLIREVVLELIHAELLKHGVVTPPPPPAK